MIQANELRIGNIVFNCGDYVVINSVDDRGINREDDNTDFNVKCRSYYCSLPGPIGIILTVEILEKCGFKKDKFSDSWSRFTNKLYCLEISILHDGVFTPTFNIKYLHQLQNLYFALTGEKLDVSGLK